MNKGSQAKKEIRVLHLSTAVNWRGGEQQLFYLWRELNALKITQALFLPKGQVFQKLTNFGLKPQKLHFRQPWLILDAFKIAQYCRNQKINILHAHDAKAHSMAILSHSLFGSPASIIVHRRVDNPIKHTALTKWKYNHSAVKAVIGVSQCITSLVADYLKFPQKAILIYSSVDIIHSENSQNTSLHELLNLPNQTQLVGNISALDKHKDPLTFIKTAAEVIQQSNNVHFVWIGGDSGMESEALRLRKELKLEDRLHFTGYIDGAKRFLPSLDVFLFTSKTEGLGSTVLDALSAGIPVVSTNAGGIKEIITDMETGNLCKVEDVNQLSTKVLHLLNNPKTAKVMGHNGLKKVKETFSPQKMAKDTLKVYQRALDPTKSH